MKIEDIVKLHQTSQFEVVISKCGEGETEGFCVTLVPDPAAGQDTKTVYNANRRHNPNFYTLETQRSPTRIFRAFQTAASTLKKHGIENIRVKL